MFCVQCGIDLPPSARFCPRCGNSPESEKISLQADATLIEKQLFSTVKRNRPKRMRLTTPIPETSDNEASEGMLTPLPIADELLETEVTAPQPVPSVIPANQSETEITAPQPRIANQSETEITAPQPRIAKKPEMDVSVLHKPVTSLTPLPTGKGSDTPTKARDALALKLFKGNRRNLFIISGLLFLLLILISSGLLYYGFVFITNQQAVNNEKTSLEATQTYRVYQDFYALATSGIPVLSDSLREQSDTDWDIYEAKGGGGCSFRNEALFISIPQKGMYVPCYAQSRAFQNFSLEVDITLLKGEETGILFRSDDRNNTGYSARIASDGFCTLYTHEGNTRSTVLFSQHSDLIQMGEGKVNTLTIVAEEDTLYLYINKRFVGNVSNNKFAEGKIAALATLTQDADPNITEASFKNLRIWEL